MNTRLFFALIVVGVVGYPPGQGRVSQYMRRALKYEDCQKRVVAWHRTELARLNSISEIEEQIRIALEKMRPGRRTRAKSLRLG